MLPREQTQFLCLEDQIPDGHEVRVLDAVLREVDWTASEELCDEGRCGQLPIHPRLQKRTIKPPTPPRAIQQAA